MNQRLKEIMLAHGLHKNISKDCQHRMEMLAELLIQESIDVVTRKCASPTARQALIEHFGVE